MPKKELAEKNKDSSFMFKENFIVITGGPGAGKTTVLDELQKRNCTCIPEVARDIIKRQMATGGQALPWINPELFLEMMLESTIKSYIKAERINKNPVFFDRGVIDSLTYAKIIQSDISKRICDYSTRYRYNQYVFFLPSWREIYVSDSERKQSWEEAVRSAELNAETYKENGYKLIEVPKENPEERGDFILRNIQRL